MSKLICFELPDPATEHDLQRMKLNLAGSIEEVFIDEKDPYLIKVHTKADCDGVSFRNSFSKVASNELVIGRSKLAMEAIRYIIDNGDLP